MGEYFPIRRWYQNHCTIPWLIFSNNCCFASCIFSADSRCVALLACVCSDSTVTPSLKYFAMFDKVVLIEFIHEWRIVSRDVYTRPKRFRITAPFLPSANALSLVFLDRLLVWSIMSLLSSRATVLLIYSLPLSLWKLLIIKGNWVSVSSRAGTRKYSEIPSTGGHYFRLSQLVH